MTNRVRPRSRDDFEIAIICALNIERDAVEALLDEDYEADGHSYGKTAGDSNAYTLGRLGNQNVVIAYMPGMGTISAAAVAANLGSSFERLKVGFVVGICGGAPVSTSGEEVLLGDVIISTSVVQTDFGRRYPDKFLLKKNPEDTLGRASPEIRAFSGKISGHLVRGRLWEKTSVYLASIYSRPDFSTFAYPGPQSDILFPHDYRHKHQAAGCEICDKCKDNDREVCTFALNASCEDLGCDVTLMQDRNRLQMARGMSLLELQQTIDKLEEKQRPRLHFGRIACGNQVMKSAKHRDQIVFEEQVVGFEMESAGTSEYIPTIVVKSVCDYADSHKNKRWQKYAAAAAAACMKAILEEWRVADKPNRETNAEMSPDYPVHWTVTRPVNSLFTGRGDILRKSEQAIRDALNRPSSPGPHTIVISGIGGQGKSELCLQLAHRCRKLFWGVFWIDVSTTTSAENGFLDVANYLQVSASTWEAAREALAREGRSWLLVLDNADSFDIDYQQYLPAGTSGIVLLTSRNTDCQQYSTADGIDLEGLSGSEARELLFRAARVPSSKQDSLQNDANAVAELLRSHPLALIQAACYISRGHCTFAEYPRIFEKQGKRLLTFRPSQAQSRYRDVYATFEASAETLSSLHTEAANNALQLLSLLASCAANRLPLPILFQAAWNVAPKFGDWEPSKDDLYNLSQWHISRCPDLLQINSDSWDSFQLIEAIHLLKSFSLVTTDEHDDIISISTHPLIHVWAKDRLNSNEQHAAWVTMGCLFALAKSDYTLWLKHGRQLQPHLLSFLSWDMDRAFASEPHIMICRIYMNCCWVLNDLRCDTQLYDLMDSLQKCLGLSVSTCKFEWLDVYDLTARNYIDCGNIKEAVPLLEQTVKIRKQNMKKTDPRLLSSQHELAGAYEANEQYEAAISLLEHVVNTRSKNLANDHPSLLISKHELARAYHANGQVEKSILLLEPVVKIQDQTLAEEHPRRLTSQHMLATAYKANGQLDAAKTLLEHVVKIQDRTLAEDHPERLGSEEGLASVYKANGQNKEAITLLDHVVNIRSKSLAKDHPSLLISKHKLAQAYHANGQLEEAKTIFENVFKLRNKTFAEDHPGQIRIQWELAAVCKANGELDMAASILERVINIQCRTLAEDHPDKLTSQHELARVYKAKGEMDAGVSLLEHIVKVQNHSLAEDHRDRLASQHVLATYYWHQGYSQKAMKMMQHVVTIQRQSLSEHDPDRENGENWLRIFTREMGELNLNLETISQSSENDSSVLQKQPQGDNQKLEDKDAQPEWKLVKTGSKPRRRDFKWFKGRSKRN